MNSAPSKMKRAATETRDEIRNSAQCTALRAMTVSNPARMAAIENIQKKTDSQPERIIEISDCEFRIANCSSHQISQSAIRISKSLRFVFHGLASLFEHLAVPDESRARISR